jgi:collagenase-like PrtC family protease
MQYTVACNWDPELLERINFPEVQSLFGGIPDAVISGGRPSNAVKKLSEAEIENFIRRVHDKGWEFNFNINSTCLSNEESTRAGFEKIIKYLEWIIGLGVDSVTISNTNLLNIVRKNFPNLKTKISTFQKVNNVQQAQRFEDLGVTALMLSEHINRDFRLLKDIRRHVKCKLILIANVGCVFNCPNIFSHANSIAHNGIAGNFKTVFAESHHSYCLQKRLEDPVELVKIRWIRPEDVSFYEDVGIDMLKILERFSHTDTLAERVKAFHERKYAGNIIDLLGQMMQKHGRDGALLQIKQLSDENMEKAFRYFGAYSTALQDLYCLDNQKIAPDFINNFAKRDCDRLSCDECGYCREVAREAITVLDEAKLAGVLRRLAEVRGGIADGTLLY